MQSLERLIIIDNTNTERWEMKYYFELGFNNGYKIHILEPTTDWKFKPKLLASKNSHGVPKEKIVMMLDRYERDITVDKLITFWNLKFNDIPDQDVPVEENKSDSAEAEDIYLSDPEKDEESIENETEVSKGYLNPEVNEFIPETILPPVTHENSPVDIPGHAENDEISSLVNIFPHLTVEEVTEMYESETVNMTLDPDFAMTLQSYFGSPAPPDYLTKLPQEQMLSLDISLSFAKMIFQVRSLGSNEIYCGIKLISLEDMAAERADQAQ